MLDRLVEGGHLRGVDPVAEGGVHHNRHVRGGEAAVLLEKAPDCLVQLGQARKGPALGGDVGPVHDDPPAFGEILFHFVPQSTI